jgi:hypothetical protein
MMGDRLVMQESLFYQFRLDDHVPGDHILRAIDRFVDLEWLRLHLAGFYSGNWSSLDRSRADGEDVERRIRQALFPAVKSLDTFDFAVLPSLNKMLVLELARSKYILRRENIIALGNSGIPLVHQKSGQAVCE